MDQQLLDEQYRLQGALSRIRNLALSGHFEIPYLIEELEGLTPSLFSYFSNENGHIASILQNQDCSDELRDHANSLFTEGDRITHELFELVRRYWRRSEEHLLEEFQLQLLKILDDLEQRIGGERGADSPFFHLQTACC